MAKPQWIATFENRTLNGSDRRPYQPPLRRARGARRRVVHGWRGRGGRDRRSVRLRQEHAIVDPWRAVAAQRVSCGIARRAAGGRNTSAKRLDLGYVAYYLRPG